VVEESGTSVVVVSTHFDDAVLSCWSVIASQAEVDVVTVFTAGPDDDRTTNWDRDSGVPSATRMRQRDVENDSALALAGRSATNLDFLGADYGGGGIDHSILASALRDAHVVYVPVGLFPFNSSNPEHVVVRDACLSVRPDARLYADNPYCHFRGDVELPVALGIGLTRSVVSLSQKQREQKAEAIRCNAGELAKLEGIFGPCTDPALLEFEVFWAPMAATI
jgi:hypothetical protein